jgi:hypothetical protein
MINEKVITNKLREKNKLFVYGEGSADSGKQVKYFNDFLEVSGDRVLMSMQLVPLDMLIDSMLKFTLDPEHIYHEEKLRLAGKKVFSRFMPLDACVLIDSDCFRKYLRSLYSEVAKKEEFKDFVRNYEEKKFNAEEEMSSEYDEEIIPPAQFDENGTPIMISFDRHNDSDEKLIEAFKNLNLAFNYIQLRDIDSNLSWDNYSTLYDSIMTSDQFKDLLKEVYKIAGIATNNHWDFSVYEKEENKENTTPTIEPRGEFKF